MNIRKYTAEDFETVKSWAEARGMALVPQLLSPDGFLVEDESGPLLVAFGYLLCNCPIVQVDRLLGRPGANIAAVRRAWASIQRAIIDWVKWVNKLHGYDYRVIQGFTHKGIILESEKNGWFSDGQPLECVRYVIS